MSAYSHLPAPSSGTVTRRPSAVAVDVEGPSHPPATFTSARATLDRISSGSNGVRTPRKASLWAIDSLPVWRAGHLRLDGSLEMRRSKVLSWLLCAIALTLVIKLWPHDRVPIERPSLKSLTRSGARERRWTSRVEGIRQHWLPAPWINHRFTVMHALIRRKEETYQQRLDGRPDSNSIEGRFVQVLAFLEETPYPEPRHAPWQVLSDHRRVFQSVQCHFSTSKSLLGDVTQGEIVASHSSKFIPTNIVPADLEWATLINCPFPPAFVSIRRGKINVRLSISLAQSAVPLEVPITLTSAPVAQPEKGSTAICVSPLWGHTPAASLLEWRLHHLALGILTVHWYARDKSVQDWVKALNKEAGTRDDFFHAPPISRETYGKAQGALKDAGQYADQALYYQHCKIASITSDHPTEWVALTDVDEHFLPSKLDPLAASKSITSYISSQLRSTGSVCISRTNYRLPSFTTKHDYAGLHFGVFASYFPPVSRLIDASKCVHRVRGVETAWVHRPDVLYPGYDMVEEAREDAPMRIMHDNRRGDQGPLHMDVGTVEAAYWTALLERRRALEVKLDFAGNLTTPGLWPCRDVPCAF